MTSDGNIELIRAARGGDKSAAETLIKNNSGLVWSIARRFFGRGIDADDLYQLGCVGFLKAVEGFDEGFGTQFSTYAVPKISGEIRRFLRDDGAVKVSRTLKEQAAAILQARTALEQKLGREPTVAEIAEETGLCPEDVATAEMATGQAESLQRESGDESFSLENVLGDYAQEERLIERLALDEAISKLTEKEQMVISLRFFHGMTQDSSAKVMKVSQVQISRLERKALEKLKSIMSTAE